MLGYGHKKIKILLTGKYLPGIVTLYTVEYIFQNIYII